MSFHDLFMSMKFKFSHSNLIFFSVNLIQVSFKLLQILHKYS